MKTIDVSKLKSSTIHAMATALEEYMLCHEEEHTIDEAEEIWEVFDILNALSGKEAV